MKCFVWSIAGKYLSLILKAIFSFSVISLAMEKLWILCSTICQFGAVSYASMGFYTEVCCLYQSPEVVYLCVPLEVPAFLVLK